MKSRQKKLIALGAAITCAVLALGLSRPGRAELLRLVARVIPPAKTTETPGTAPVRPVSVAAQGLDVGQRARLAHGWSSSIVTSFARGSIIYYDSNGRATSQYAITIARAYPDRVRVEIDRGDSREVFGFDRTAAWRGGAANLSDTQARDIRAAARFCPERLFVDRDKGAAYREVGQRIEDAAQVDASADWAGAPATGRGEGPPNATPQPEQIVFDQVESGDSLGPPATRTDAGDVRRVYYYVDAATSLVSAARWLEPDNPRKSIDDATVSFTDVRVDFADWRDVNGVKWPFKLAHSTGGRLDFRIVLNGVRVNVSLADGVFQAP
jgi:hypothetical protein